jgi:hypothetical protein
MNCEQEQTKTTVRMDYVFNVNKISGKTQIMINTGLHEDQAKIMDMVKELVMPRMENNFLRKRVAKSNIAVMPQTFKAILEDMIFYGKIPAHEFYVWFEGKKI